jgi:hypothetical protein
MSCLSYSATILNDINLDPFRNIFTASPSHDISDNINQYCIDPRVPEVLLALLTESRFLRDGSVIPIEENSTSAGF